MVVVVNITTINCHLLAWCGCWRPAAHWLCATVAHRPAAQHQMVPGSPVWCVVLCGGNQENIAKITWEYDVLSELGKCVSCVVWNAGIHATLGGGLGVFEDDTQLCHYDIFIMYFFTLWNNFTFVLLVMWAFFLFSSQIGCFNLYIVHFLEQRCIRLPSASDAMSPYGEYSPQIIDD